MPKKNFLAQTNRTAIQEIVGWRTPTFHQASECYISLSAFDPSVGKMKIKKIMLGHVKGKRAQKVYGEALIKRLTEKLMQGWNPWIESVQPLEYSSFEEVLEKYKDYLLKLMKEHSMREESVVSYTSRANMLRTWIVTNKINVFYTYQFDRHIVGRFLDYIFVDRNNTIRTRNNYLAWLKTFGKYLSARGYVPKDPTDGMTTVKRKGELKNRDVIPDDILQELHDWLVQNNKHFLLACSILHYCLIRPREMSFLKVGDFSIKKQTISLHGETTKNHNDAVITVPQQVLKLMIELDIFKSPNSYFLFSNNFAPGPVRKSEKSFRDYWSHHVRKHISLTNRYKFYSLKDTGITNMLRANTDILTVRDQARHSSILITDIYTPKDIKDANELLLNYKGVL